MKKLFIFSFVLIFVCSCITTVIYPDGSQGNSISQNKVMSTKMTKKQAQSVCDQEAVSINSTFIKFYSNNGGFNPPLYSEANTKCTLN